MSPQAVRLIASLVGENLWVLSSEIEKLLIYTSGRSIDEKDVKAVVSHARDANVFAMVDALIEGRAPTAASLLYRLFEEGAAATYLVYMITRQLRMLVLSKELNQKGLFASKIKAGVRLVSGETSDYALTKALEQSNRYSMQRLEQVYHSLLETDLSIKKGISTGEVALTLLVAELCA